jgi:hypothetical protein
MALFINIGNNPGNDCLAWAVNAVEVTNHE